MLVIKSQTYLKRHLYIIDNYLQRVVWSFLFNFHVPFSTHYIQFWLLYITIIKWKPSWPLSYDSWMNIYQQNLCLLSMVRCTCYNFDCCPWWGVLVTTLIAVHGEVYLLQHWLLSMVRCTCYNFDWCPWWGVLVTTLIAVHGEVYLLQLWLLSMVRCTCYNFLFVSYLLQASIFLFYSGFLHQ